MQISEGVELVRFSDIGEGNLQIQMAIKGQLAPMIDDHKASMERFRSDAEYFSFLAKQSETLIHIFGDARNPFSDSVSEARSQEGF